MNLLDISDLESGLSVIRDAEFSFFGLIDHGRFEKTITYLSELKYMEQVLKNKNISAIITSIEIAGVLSKSFSGGIITSENPKKSFYIIHNYLAKNTDFYGVLNENDISNKSIIHPTAVIASRGVKIGEGTKIGPYVVIGENTTIGKNCYIGMGTSIGERGFQYYKDEQDLFFIEHIAKVVIEDNVEILSNVCIVKGLFEDTVVGESTKIDNLIHIAHSVQIGKRVLLPAGIIFGGSVKVEDDTWIGINATIAPGITLDENSYVCMGAVVTRDVDKNQKVSGNFAMEHSKFIKFVKSIS